MTKKKQYPVYCSWCEQEGKKTVISYVDTPGSHGICSKHHKEMMKQIKEQRKNSPR